MVLFLSVVYVCLDSCLTLCGINLYGGSYAFARGSFSKIYLLTGVVLRPPLPALPGFCLLRGDGDCCGLGGGMIGPLSGVKDKLSVSLPALSRKAYMRVVFGFSETL